MNNVVTLNNDYGAAQLRLIKNTIAKECTDIEFQLFVELAKQTGLDLFRKQVHAQIFNKDKPEKRQLTLIISIDGYRVIAERTGKYRPDDEPPRFEYDNSIKGKENPLGLISATVSLFKQDNIGAWHKSSHTAYWDEYAPITQWGLGDTWKKMGRIMLAKCCEAALLRKSFPDALGGLYSQDEMEKVSADMTALEVIEADDAKNRLAKIGGAGILFQLDPMDGLINIPHGQIMDRVISTIDAMQSVLQIEDFTSRNRESLTQFWAFNKADALELKKIIEVKTKALNDN